MPQQKTREHDFGSTMRIVGEVVEADKEDELSHFAPGKQEAWVGVRKIEYFDMNHENKDKTVGKWFELEEGTDIADLLQRNKDLETENNQLQMDNTKLKRRIELQIGEVTPDAE